MSVENNEFPRKSQNSSGTTHGYRVEGRSVVKPIVVPTGQIFDGEWREVNFPESDKGISYPIDPSLYKSGLNTFNASQALRWWLLAEIEHTRVGIHLETRLVEYEVRYEQVITAVGASHIIKCPTWLYKEANEDVG